MDNPDDLLDSPRSPLLLDPAEGSLPVGYFVIRFDAARNGVFRIMFLRPGEQGPSVGEGVSRRIAFLPQVVDSRMTEELLGSEDSRLQLAETLDRDAFRYFYLLPRPEGGLLTLTPEEAEPVLRCFGELDLLFADRSLPLRPCRARSALISLLYGLGYRQPERSGGPELSVWESVRLFLHRDPDRAVTIPELCRRFNTNRNTLSREFRKLTGCTVTEYRTRIRLGLAQKLLAETALPVGEIAGRCGIGDLTRFGRLFRDRTGLTPTAYRKSSGLPFC